jgi:hypothetical protein
VVPELILALPVAVLVGIVPGYFWAKCLSSSGDRVERIVYSTALSMALVPTAALLQVRVFGTGVTLVIAAVSVAAVFATGLAAYLWLGPARYTDEPVVDTPPAPPGAFALLALSAAFAIVLGLVPEGRSAFFVALLLLLVAVVAWLVSSPPPRSGRPWVSCALMLAVLAIVLLRGYLGPVVHDWPFIRGGDQFSHAVMTNLMMSEGETGSYLIYPPGFHTLAALVSRLSGLEPLEIFPVLAPALTVLPALACYVLARRLWGPGHGVVAAFFSGVLLVGPYASFSEARYPNLVAADFLIVLAVAALIGVYGSPGARSGLLLAVLGSSVVLYHQVASFYLALLLALVVVLFLPYLLLRRKREAIPLSISLSLLGFLSVVYAWSTYDLPRLLSGLVGDSDTGAGGRAITTAIGSQEPLSLGHLMEMTSQPVVWLALLGAGLVAGDLLRGRSGTPQRLAYLTLLLWAVLLFVGSRTSLSGFPQRFERDLGIPLAILAALSFVTVLRSPTARRPRPSVLTGLVAALAAALAIAVVGLKAAENLGGAPSNNVISPEVAAAGEWLEAHNTGGNIVVTPYLNDHIPGSAMLATGGYTGLRSYTQKRLRSPRALPPSGKEPLLAARWVMLHPVGERTASILATYDIRYVILFKRYPGVHPQAFEDRPGRYRKVFENSSVVIFAPRNSSRPQISEGPSRELRLRGLPGVSGPRRRQVHQELPGELLARGQVSGVVVQVFVLVRVGAQVVELARGLGEACPCAGHAPRQVGDELPVARAPHVGGSLLRLGVSLAVHLREVARPGRLGQQVRARKLGRLRLARDRK